MTQRELKLHSIPSLKAKQGAKIPHPSGSNGSLLPVPTMGSWNSPLFIYLVSGNFEWESGFYIHWAEIKLYPISCNVRESQLKKMIKISNHII